MKRIVHVAFAALVLAAASTSAGRADDQSDIRTLYARLNSAMRSRNADKVLALVTPDFKERRVNGTILEGKQAEQAMRSRFASTKSVEVAFKPDSITVKGDKAVIWTSYTLKSTMVDKDGKMGAKGATHVFADTGKTRDILLRTPQGWKFSEVKTLKQAPTMDGKSTYQMGPRGRR